MKISLELVPRNNEYIIDHVRYVEDCIPQISALNFPDLSRFSIRSWQACHVIPHSNLKKIAHLRAIDFDVKHISWLSGWLNFFDIQNVLVIGGDKPEDTSDKAYYPTTTIDLIRGLKRHASYLNIYAAFDPYRTNIRYELEYLQRKKYAGAKGFFSQPFFDLRLLEIYSEFLEGEDVYWGICPVTGKSSQNYWEVRNRAVFPKYFEPTLEWNIAFAKEVMNFCQNNNYNTYLMPININIKKYLNMLFHDL